MSLKAMVFIDGSWMFHNKQQIIESYKDENYEIDYRRIPWLIQQHLGECTDLPIDVVRTHYFGSIPINKPGYDSSKQQAFYRFLEDKCAFETHIYDIDFHNDPNSHPKEKCVDISLATNMLYYAMLPNVFDVAILVAGDLDYLPLIQQVRRLGKRVLLVGLRNIGDYYPTSKRLLDNHSLFDLPTIFIDDHLEDIRLERELVPRECQSCGHEELTTWHGDDFYCNSCRATNTKRSRSCDSCGKTEETTWNKPYFYCADCRQKHREVKMRSNSYFL